MFQIGDKVVHKMEGACYIEDKVTMVVNKEQRQYYKLIPLLDRKAVVYIPFGMDVQDRIRPVISQRELAAAEEEIIKTDAIWELNDKKRLKITTEIIKGFDFLENALLIKELLAKNSQRVLGAKDQQFLVTAQKLVYSEIAIVLNLEYATIVRKMDTYYQQQIG